jgi:hypothetical protein
MKSYREAEVLLHWFLTSARSRSVGRVTPRATCLRGKQPHIPTEYWIRDRITILGATNRYLTHNINYASSEQFIAPISTSDLQHVFINGLVDWMDFCPWRQCDDKVKVTTHTQTLTGPMSAKCGTLRPLKLQSQRKALLNLSRDK